MTKPNANTTALNLFGDEHANVVSQTELSATAKEINQLFDDADAELAEMNSEVSGELQDENQHQFFSCDIFEGRFKDDMPGMDVPIFTLATKAPDLTPIEWRSADGKSFIRVTPSVLGRATQLDKDLLIYITSQITEGLNQGRADAKSRVVRFKIYDFLKSTGKDTGGKTYARIEEQLNRLRGTTLSTNIKTANHTIKGSFGLIDSWRSVEKDGDSQISSVEVTLSRWAFDAIQARQVLTINPKYFELKKPIEKKIYEIARKHCGNKPNFKISKESLQNKVGSGVAQKEFTRMLKDIIAAGKIPDYEISLIEDGDTVLFKNLSNIQDVS